MAALSTRMLAALSLLALVASQAPDRDELSRALEGAEALADAARRVDEQQGAAREGVIHRAICYLFGGFSNARSSVFPVCGMAAAFRAPQVECLGIGPATVLMCVPFRLGNGISSPL